MIEEIIACVKSNKLIPINYTSKLTSIVDAGYFIKYKIGEAKYDNVVFIIDTKNIPCDCAKEFIQDVVLSQVPRNQRREDKVLMIYKQLVNVISPLKEFSLRKTNNFLKCNQNRFECCICFDEFVSCHTCTVCDATFCYKCFDKLRNENNRKLFELHYEDPTITELIMNCPCCRGMLNKGTIYMK
jgi:hypothetical protein